MPDSPNPEQVLPTRKRRPSNAILDSKWNTEHIHAVKFWLESLLHTTLPTSEQLASGTPFEDGQLLFCVARTLAPDFRPNVRMVDSQLPFLAGNNVDFFLAFLKELKVPEWFIFDKMDVMSNSHPENILAALDEIRRMNTPSFATNTYSRPGTPVSDIPSLMDLPSAITDSVEYPLVLKSRKKNVYVYQLPDLATKDPTPPVECDPCPVEDMSNELVIPSTRPLRVQAHHLEPTPGVHIRIVQFDPPIEEEMTGGFPKIEIFLDIVASVPRVNMDVRAKMAGECFVHVHKPSVHPLIDAGAQHGKDAEEQDGEEQDGEKREQAKSSQKREQGGPECVLVEEHDPPLSSVGNDSGRVVDKAGCQCSPTCHRGEEFCSAAADTYFGVELGPRSLWD